MAFASLCITRSVSRFVRVFRLADYASVNHELSKVDWSGVIGNDDIDVALNNFYEILDKVISTYIPMKKCYNTKYPN